MVAFETARLLMAAGHKVDMVAMVDPPTVSARPVPRAIIGLMKPIVSPYLLRWTYELMARLERFFMASTSKQITIAKLYNALFNPSYTRFRRRYGTLIQSQWRNIFRHRSRSLWLFTRPNTTVGRGGISVLNSKWSRCQGDIMAA